MNAPTTASAAPSVPTTQQYLSMVLGGEQYAVEIGRVQEIKGWDTVTPVPHTPNYVLGVINLRGSIVPIVDLRLRFGVARTVCDASTVIVVVRVAAERGERIVGMVVDAVADVYDIAADNIRPSPHILDSIDTVFVKGLADRDGKLLILIDVERLMTSSISSGSEKAA